ncbi:adenylate/guanylate cyclase domain-containing protein [Ramlibacter alkalitolerans]|uniref:Alpha/beta fold hydrolase n=1 Tax=Ramlibacter alkalitolerans TaxID=2039631 RepID=A0ABS1JL80_9BURK|nr:alpha/beta fold hydrolase [Ramlibacter alkalitolerans]MBL0424946.1 alpha/beta fold hydrolase [Ramlibacter alkalitolerans]
MQAAPETRYTRCGGQNVAYQSYGHGAEVLVIAPSNLFHLEASWALPAAARMGRRIGRFVRVIRYDRRGIGLSDRLPPGTTLSLQERAEELIAVMDATEVPKAVLFGSADGGLVAAFVAATFPERVQSLVLYATSACLRSSPGYEPGLCEPDLESRLGLVRQHWGSNAAPFGFEWLMPSVGGDAELRHMLARAQRLAAPPEVAADAYRWMCDADIRTLLPCIAVPTLVLHKTGDRSIPIGHGRYLASHIPGARFVELPGTDHLLFTENTDAYLDALEAFITGRGPEREPDRPIATLLFTDIVGSTSTAVAMGDTGWTNLLEHHDEEVRAEIVTHGGRVVDNAGDGMFALFTAPARAIQCALSIQDHLRSLHLQIRAGIHTGEIESRGHRISGVAVHLGARIVAAAQPGEILVSRTVRDLVAGSAICFRDRGPHTLKGLSEPWQLFGVLRARDT